MRAARCAVGLAVAIYTRIGMEAVLFRVAEDVVNLDSKASRAGGWRWRWHGAVCVGDTGLGRACRVVFAKVVGTGARRW